MDALFLVRNNLYFPKMGFDHSFSRFLLPLQVGAGRGSEEKMFSLLYLQHNPPSMRGC
jgi:hypothetical protein